MSLRIIASRGLGARPVVPLLRGLMIAMLGLILVDFDNLRSGRDKSRGALERDASALLDEIPRVFLEAFPAALEMDVRFYGGWTDELGQRARDARWLNALLPSLRGRRGGIIVRPALATSMIQFQNITLRGTVRGVGRKRRQKMVDGMIGSDAMFVRANAAVPIGIASDDDDMVPSALSVSAQSPQAFAWMRRREVGAALNDDALLRQGLRIYRMM